MGITTRKSTHRTTTTHHTLREGTPHTNHTLHTLDRGEDTVATKGRGEVTLVDREIVSPGTGVLEVEMEEEEGKEMEVMGEEAEEEEEEEGEEEEVEEKGEEL